MTIMFGSKIILYALRLHLQCVILQTLQSSLRGDDEVQTFGQASGRGDVFSWPNDPNDHNE